MSLLEKVEERIRQFKENYNPEFIEVSEVEVNKYI